MALSLATVGGKITAYLFNQVVGAVNKQGMTAIVPTGVTPSGGMATVGTNGVITLSAVSNELGINGLFTSGFDNYRLILNLNKSASYDLAVRMRSTGLDNSAAQYNSQRTGVSGTATNASQQLAGTSWPWDQGAVIGATDFIVDLLGPALVTATRATTSFGSVSSTGATTVGTGYHVHSVATAYDGLGLIFASGTVTGTIRVYGYNNN